MKKITIQIALLGLLQFILYFVFDITPTFWETALVMLLYCGVLLQVLIYLRKIKKNITKEYGELNEHFINNQEKLNKTFESVADGIIITDKNLTITMINNSAAIALGYKNYKQLLNSNLTEIFENVVVNNTNFIEFVKIVMNQKKSISLSRLEYKDKIFADSLSPIKDFNDEPEGLIIVFNDITEKIKKEKHTKELEDQIYQTQKMDAIGELSGGLAHDFNNILTSISGYMDLIELEAESIPKIKNYIDKSKESISSAAALTNKLMTFSKNQIVDPRVVDIKETLNNFHDIIKKGIGEDIPVVLELHSKKLIKVDIGQLEQIFLNLAINAKDAIKEKNIPNGKIIFETLDYFSPETNQEYVVLKCMDNGIGMDDEVKNRLFEPFYTTKKTGRGLGLSSVYGIIRQNNAHIIINSKKGIGTTFEIQWPITNEPLTSIVKNKKKALKSKKGETILFVEDSPSIRDIIAKYLTALGYNMVIAEHGKDALEKIKTIKKLDLIITDVIMPEMGGYELIENVKKILPKVKVIFTSGYANSTNILIEKDYSIIKKPYSLHALSQKISKILSE